MKKIIEKIKAFFAEPMPRVIIFSLLGLLIFVCGCSALDGGFETVVGILTMITGAVTVFIAVYDYNTTTAKKTESAVITETESKEPDQTAETVKSDSATDAAESGKSAETTEGQSDSKQ
ncbi:MAG: hypothetical protein LKK19_01860 [Bacteroidales bacterium]|jgi:Ca2+/Na+ antiporter|nr:hypothetical protein [Bacteroidales bacterium]MCI2145856.1 hypothetical protein [Bacteroidales bacterium]